MKDAQGGHFSKRDTLMMLSNAFLIFPVLFAARFQAWAYLFIAAGLLIASPLFHWFRINNQHSPWYTVFRVLDWLFALSAFLYLYAYVRTHLHGWQEALFYLLLSLVIIFFWYGWRYADYKKLHPWFHGVASVVAMAILIAAHL